MASFVPFFFGFFFTLLNSFFCISELRTGLTAYIQRCHRENFRAFRDAPRLLSQNLLCVELDQTDRIFVRCVRCAVVMLCGKSRELMPRWTCVRSHLLSVAHKVSGNSASASSSSFSVLNVAPNASVPRPPTSNSSHSDLSYARAPETSSFPAPVMHPRPTHISPHFATSNPMTPAVTDGASAALHFVGNRMDADRGNIHECSYPVLSFFPLSTSAEPCILSRSSRATSSSNSSLSSSSLSPPSSSSSSPAASPASSSVSDASACLEYSDQLSPSPSFPQPPCDFDGSVGVPPTPSLIQFRDRQQRKRKIVSGDFFFYDTAHTIRSRSISKQKPASDLHPPPTSGAAVAREMQLSARLPFKGELHVQSVGEYALSNREQGERMSQGTNKIASPIPSLCNGSVVEAELSLLDADVNLDYAFSRQCDPLSVLVVGADSASGCIDDAFPKDTSREVEQEVVRGLSMLERQLERAEVRCMFSVPPATGGAVLVDGEAREGVDALIRDPHNLEPFDVALERTLQHAGLSSNLALLADLMARVPSRNSGSMVRESPRVFPSPGLREEATGGAALLLSPADEYDAGWSSLIPDSFECRDGHPPSSLPSFACTNCESLQSILAAKDVECVAYRAEIERLTTELLHNANNSAGTPPAPLNASNTNIFEEKLQESQAPLDEQCSQRERQLCACTPQVQAEEPFDGRDFSASVTREEVEAAGGGETLSESLRPQSEVMAKAEAEVEGVQMQIVIDQHPQCTPGEEQHLEKNSSKHNLTPQNRCQSPSLNRTISLTQAC